VPIPDYETLMLPLLRQLEGGASNVSESLPGIIVQFQITKDEAAEMLASGRVTVLQSRTHWARTYLAKAGLLHSPKRNVHELTKRARDLLNSNPERIDNSNLDRFPEFAEWRNRSSSTAKGSGDVSKRPDPAQGPEVQKQTPEDAIGEAISVLNAVLYDDLSGLIRSVSPVGFEALILDLLIAMGYGGGLLERKRMTSRSRDGGIDGIIDEDALGLDAVYIQAKQFGETKVGRPELQKFVGSLTGEGASKGVFVTTTDFSKDAYEYVSRVQHRIRLINGDELAELMATHNVGVRTRATYHMKSVDEDYFSEK